MLKKVVFLDRDGTINQDSVDYIKGWPEFVFLPRSIEALRDLTAAGFMIIVITNQSAIARKLISPRELENIHSKMKATVQSQGGKICDIFFCPHLPDDGCDCRKPAPGLLLQAAEYFASGFDEMVLIGDSMRDLEAARAAGIRTILVRTGNGRKTEQQLSSEGALQEVEVYDDLAAASDALLRELD